MTPLHRPQPPAPGACHPVPAGSGNGKLRVHALTHLWSPADGASPATFAASLERAVAAAARNRAPDRPDLVLLGELTALPLAFGGRRGAEARQQRTLAQALLFLARSYREALLCVRKTFPGVSPMRALLLALSDAIWTPFRDVLPALARRHGVYLVAGIPGAEVRPSSDPDDVRRFDPDAGSGAHRTEVLVPVSPEVYNRAVLFGPDGRCLGEAHKVHLTPGEDGRPGSLDLSPGHLEAVAPLATPCGPLGLLVCYDGFCPDVVGRLAGAGAKLILQPSSNAQAWAAPAAGSGRWQPEEWEDAAALALAGGEGAPRALFHACAMTAGPLFDVTFDGQSAVARAGRPPLGEPPPALHGLDPAEPHRLARSWHYLAVTPRTPDGAAAEAAGVWVDLDLGWSDPEQAAAARSKTYRVGSDPSIFHFFPLQ